MQRQAVKLYTQLKPKTQNQAHYIRTISENIVTLCHGCPGTGKSTIAVGLACEYLHYGKVDRIVITRPVVEVSDTGGLGYLPGDFNEKLFPYLVPVLEELYKFLGPKEVRSLQRSNGSPAMIEIVPLELMRGRNFHNSFVVLDEAQNATMKQIKMFLTRIGTNCKVVMNGDIDQVDIDNTGFETTIRKLDKCPDVGIVKLGPQDIIRNKVIWNVLERLQ